MMRRWLFLLACAVSLVACADDSETGKRVDRTADRAVERVHAPFDKARDIVHSQDAHVEEIEEAWDE